MEQFDKKIKNLLQEESTLPIDFSWDKMKGGIEEKMGENQERRRWRPFMFWLLGSVAIIAVVSLLIINLLPNNDLEKKKSDHIYVTNKPIDHSQNKSKQKSAPSTKPKEAIDLEKTVNSEDAIKKPIVKKKKQTFSKQLATNTLSPSDQFSPITHNVSNVRKNISQKLIESKEEVSPLDLIPEIAITELCNERNNHLVGSIELLKKKERVSSIGFTGNTLLWKLTSANETDQIKYESSIPSFGISAFYQHSLKKGFVLYSGLSYQSLESKFDWSGTVDHEFTLHDTTTHIEHNILTQKQTHIQGNVVLDGTAEREVLHYNYIRQVQFSIGIGKEFSLNRLRLQVGGAIVPNYIIQADGKTISNNDVVEFNSRTAPLYDNRFGIGTAVDLQISYPLYSKLDFVFRSGITTQWTNLSTNKDFGVKPVVSNFGAGLRYNLN